MNINDPQSLLNTIAYLASDMEKADDNTALIYGLLNAYSSAATTSKPAVNKLEGIDFERNVVKNYTLLVESVEDHIEAFIKYATERTDELLSNEYIRYLTNNDSRVLSVSGQESKNFDALDSMVASDEKQLLAEQYAALGYRVIERRVDIDIDHPGVREEISNRVGNHRDLEASVDVTMRDKGISVYLPADEDVLDDVKSIIQSVVGREDATVYLHPMKTVSATIPGFKDVADYVNRLQKKAELKSKFGESSPGMG